MTAELLNVLVGAAVTDRDFCQALLNNPGHTARRFGLGPEDVEALSGIRAHSLSEFAGQLLNWMPRDSKHMSYAAAR
jgi:hypothetical protein